MTLLMLFLPWLVFLLGTWFYFSQKADDSLFLFFVLFALLVDSSFFMLWKKNNPRLAYFFQGVALLIGILFLIYEKTL